MVHSLFPPLQENANPVIKVIDVIPPDHRDKNLDDTRTTELDVGLYRELPKNAGC